MEGGQELEKKPSNVSQKWRLACSLASTHGLLPLLASITRSIHISQLSGLRVAVDAYVWLHCGTYGCSSELCQNIATDKYLVYCMKMISLLKMNGIIPVLVFDGGNLPSKRETEKHRRVRRDESKQKGMECLANGDRKQAVEFFKHAVDVTPRMAFNLIQLLKKQNIEYIVAPYEADAQLAYLARNHFVDAVLSEDSDLIPYGCPRIIYKLDKDGHGKEIRLEDLGSVTEVSFKSFSSEMLRHMCILSGCDYLEGLAGIGLKNAYKLLAKYGNMADVFQALGSKTPMEYRLAFAKADITFQHQVVFDPKSKKAIHLTPLPDDFDESQIPFVGERLSDFVAQNIAVGNFDPHTHEPFLLTSSSDLMKGSSPNNNESPTNDSILRSSSYESAHQQRLSLPPTNHFSRKSMTFDQIADHDNAVTRDVRQYAMRRGSSISVNAAASTAASIVNSPPVNTLHSYFPSLPPTTNNSSAMSLKKSNNTVSKLSAQNSPANSPSQNSGPHSNLIIRSKFFSPTVSTHTNSLSNISSPSSTNPVLTLSSSSFSDVAPVFDDDVELYTLPPDLDAIITSGRRDSIPIYESSPATPPPPKITSINSAVVPQSSFKVNSQNQLLQQKMKNQSSPQNQMVASQNSPTPSRSKIVLPSNIATHSFIGDESDDEQYELVRIAPDSPALPGSDSSTSPTKSGRYGIVSLSIKPQSKPSSEKKAAISLFGSPEEQERHNEKKSDSQSSLQNSTETDKQSSSVMHIDIIPKSITITPISSTVGRQITSTVPIYGSTPSPQHSSSLLGSMLSPYATTLLEKIGRSSPHTAHSVGDTPPPVLSESPKLTISPFWKTSSTSNFKVERLVIQKDKSSSDVQSARSSLFESSAMELKNQRPQNFEAMFAKSPEKPLGKKRKATFMESGDTLEAMPPLKMNLSELEKLREEIVVLDD